MGLENLAFIVPYGLLQMHEEQHDEDKKLGNGLINEKEIRVGMGEIFICLIF